MKPIAYSMLLTGLTSLSTHERGRVEGKRLTPAIVVLAFGSAARQVCQCSPSAGYCCGG
jgi:hypothetical protein